LIAAYLHGSAVLGGMLPTSDADVLAVIDRPTTDEERQQLVKLLMAISLPSRAHSTRPIELTVVNRSDVRPWRYPPRMQFQYGEWERPGYEAGEVPAPRENADLAALISVVLMGNRPLLGPPPAQLLDPVPVADLRRAIVAGIPELMHDLEPDTRNVLLTLARIWHTTATGEIVRKDVAASWSAERLRPPEGAIVTRARDQYLQGSHGEDTWPRTMAEVRAAAAAMLTEIERADPKEP